MSATARCIFAVLVLGASSASAQGWKRTRMAHGVYAAYVSSDSGAELRAACGPSPDGPRPDIQSISYVPKGSFKPGTVRGSITVDGTTKQHEFQVEQEGNDPAEIKLGSDDLDSLESLKDLIISIRKGRSLTIEVPALRLRDTFALSDAGRALGECR